MMWRVVLLLTFCATGALAQTNVPEPVPAPQECSSCTALHQSLQRLQAARVPPVASGQAEPVGKADAGEKKTDDQ